MARESEKTKKLNSDDLGFGKRFGAGNHRVLNKAGDFNIKRIGTVNTLYTKLINMKWWAFFLYTLLFYILINSAFALIYFFIGVDELGVDTSKYRAIDELILAYYFSTQTLTTVGYGFLNPFGKAAALVASFESLVGLLSFAIAGALLYGRFSRPRPGIIFSDKALLSDMEEGKRALMLRVANAQESNMIEVKARLLCTYLEDKKGKIARTYRELKLERNEISMLPLNWTLVHWIDEGSPLNNMTYNDLEENECEFIILIEAFNDSIAQLVHARTSFKMHEVLENHKFKIPYSLDEEGVTTFNLHLISESEPM